jgi:hypothetical protein
MTHPTGYITDGDSTGDPKNRSLEHTILHGTQWWEYKNQADITILNNHKIRKKYW